ncbi:MFS transporter [Paraburkholderia sabiae]|uniref:MFS transporter n=1 Tax=Paraburkholderia sabiae TaxID=273251 RepID=A0ABU9QHX2_9BURK|nr:MFS transporter [Paraburkholderia sabiae]WJZ77407.1 MFS transporter [Paraburkholderia sabiae]CAD6557692.1 L-lactate transporter [Paraburkholderia sabiae]
MERAVSKLAEFRRGWSLLLTATVGSAVGLVPIMFYSLGSFIGPLHSEFGWNRGEISMAYLLATVVLSVAAPGLGVLIDRYGVRKLALLSIPLLAAVLFAISRCERSVLAFQSLYGLAALLGLGATPVVYTHIVAGAFDKARGLALGIAMSGVAVTTAGLPLLLATIIQAYGWRGGYVTLAILVLVAWPFVLHFTRGLKVSAARKQTIMVDTSVFRLPVFWIIGIAFTAVAIAVGAVIVHLVPMLRDAGLSALAAASVAGFVGIGAIVGRLATGYLVDHLFAPYVAACMFLLTSISFVLLLFTGTTTAPLAAALTGLSLGVEIDLMAYLTARYFGMLRYGFVYSVIYSMFAIGGAIGPAAAGRAFDMSGNYRTTLWAAAALRAISAITILRLPRFGRIDQQDSEMLAGPIATGKG